MRPLLPHSVHRILPVLRKGSPSPESRSRAGSHKGGDRGFRNRTRRADSTLLREDRQALPPPPGGRRHAEQEKLRRPHTERNETPRHPSLADQTSAQAPLIAPRGGSATDVSCRSVRRIVLLPPLDPDAAETERREVELVRAYEPGVKGVAGWSETVGLPSGSLPSTPRSNDSSSSPRPSGTRLLCRRSVQRPCSSSARPTSAPARRPRGGGRS